MKPEIKECKICWIKTGWSLNLLYPQNHPLKMAHNFGISATTSQKCISAKKRLLSDLNIEIAFENCSILAYFRKKALVIRAWLCILHQSCRILEKFQLLYIKAFISPDQKVQLFNTVEQQYNKQSLKNHVILDTSCWENFRNLRKQFKNFTQKWNKT